MFIDDRRVLDAEKFSLVCSGCRHLFVEKFLKDGVKHCAAYDRSQIPGDIWSADDDHTRQRGDEDNPGIVYSPREETIFTE